MPPPSSDTKGHAPLLFAEMKSRDRALLSAEINLCAKLSHNLFRRNDSTAKRTPGDYLASTLYLPSLTEANASTEAAAAPCGPPEGAQCKFPFFFESANLCSGHFGKSVTHCKGGANCSAKCLVQLSGSCNGNSVVRVVPQMFGTLSRGWKKTELLFQKKVCVIYSRRLIPHMIHPFLPSRRHHVRVRYCELVHRSPSLGSHLVTCYAQLSLRRRAGTRSRTDRCLCHASAALRLSSEAPRCRARRARARTAPCAP